LRSVYHHRSERQGTFRNRFIYMSGRWVASDRVARPTVVEPDARWLIRTDYQRLLILHVTSRS